MALQIGRQDRIGRRDIGALLLGHHLDLLADAALDDGVILPKPLCHPLAIKDFVAHPGIDQAGQFLVSRRPAPQRRILAAQFGHIALTDGNRLPPEIAGADDPVEQEQRQADKEKVQERFAQD